MSKEPIFLAAAIATLVATSPALGEIFSVPRSNALLAIEVTLPDGQTAQVQVRDGSMISVRDEDTGYMYAFVAALDKGAQQTSFTPLSISDLGDNRQRADQIATERTFDFQKDGSIETQHGSFGFRVNEINLAASSAPLLDPRLTRPNTLKKVYGKSGGGSCCVSCGSITVCGDSVSLRCGSCDGGAMTY